MPISWYPGHMVTARKEAASAMRTIDLVIEVLDARVPRASCNPLIEGLRAQSGRPALKVLNKSDLADPSRTRAWLDFYRAQPGIAAVALSAKKPQEVARILKIARGILPARGTTERPLRMMILGIPNVGKSTLMNALLKRHVAAVGDEPAITKIHMGHALGDDMWLIDTPGLMWPEVEPESAVKLAATHSIGRNAYQDGAVAADLGAYLLEHYPELLAQRFGPMPPGCDGEGLIACVARRRGFLGPGGVPDLNKAAAILLNDFRAGALGRITLEEAPPQSPGARKPLY